MFEPTAIVLTIKSTGTTCGNSNGSILVTAEGGTAPYRYSIDHYSAQSTGNFLRQTAGIHMIKVTDAIGETVTRNVTLTNTFSKPTLSTIRYTLPSGCDTRDATMTLGATGGTSPYTFSIDFTNFQASNVFTGLNAGSYSCGVKDANGCTSVKEWYNETLIPERCAIRQNGQNLSHLCDPFRSWLGLLNVSGGVPPYQYSLDGVNFQTNDTFFPLTSGLYTVTVKDAAGTILLYSVAVNDKCYSAININATITPAQCGQNGSIALDALDGTSPYFFSIDGVNFQESKQFSGLAPGAYTITVKDGYNSSSSKLVTVGNSCLSVSANPVSSTCGKNNGRIQVQASSGTAPYQYSIDGINFTTSDLFTNLVAGTYHVTVKDANGSSKVTSVTVNNIAGPVVSQLTAVPADCSNTNGAISFNAQGGTAPFQYRINQLSYQSSPVFTGLTRGTYSVMIQDANGCTATDNIAVAINNTMSVHAGTNVTICEGEKATLTATSNGSSFSWSPVMGLSTTSGLTPVASPKSTIIYTLTAIKGECISTSDVTVFVHPAPVASAGKDTTICLGQDVHMSGSGGVQYLWTPSSYLSDRTVADPVVQAPPKGNYTYSVVVKDNNGCSSLAPATVRIIVFSPSVYAGRDTVILANQPFQLQATDLNNYGFVQYHWYPPTGMNNPGVVNPVAAIDNDIIYTVTAQTANGCIATDDIQIKVYRGIDIYVPTAFTPNNDRLNDILKAYPVGIKEFKSFRVYNRWGQVVFQTVEARKGWDGKVNGILQEGVFVWTVEGVDYNGRSLRKKGTVMVIR